MKKRLSLLMASLFAVGFLTFGVTSCNKDDKKDPDQQEVEGATNLASLKEAIDVANKAGETVTETFYSVKGQVTEITNKTFGFYTIKDTSGTLNVISESGYDTLEAKPKVGDNVTLKGKLGLEVGVPTLSDAVIINIETGSTPDTKPDGNKNDLKVKYNCIEIADAKEKATAAGDNGTSEKFAVYGKITKITSDTWGNMVIGEGDETIFAYGPQGWKTMANKPAVGDEIVLKGVLKTHETKPQIFEPEILEFRKAGSEGGNTPTPDKPSTGEDLKTKYNCISVADAIEKGTAAGDNGTSEQFYVYGKITKITTPKWGNMVIGEGQDTIYVRGPKGWDTLTTKPEVGNEIVLKGILKTYDSKPQIFEPEIIEFK